MPLKVLEDKNKLKLVEYKGGKCEICGYDKCVDALEFHHLNPDEKEFGLSNVDTRALSILKKEADKCILICSNCHREIHYKEKLKELENKHNEEKNKETSFFQRNKTIRKTKSYIENTIQTESVLNDIKNGLTKKEISKKYNIGLTTLKRFLMKNNIVYNESQVSKLKDLTIDKFITDFNEIKSFSGVAKLYGVSDKAIQKWCMKVGLPWRKKDLLEFIKK